MYFKTKMLRIFLFEISLVFSIKYTINYSSFAILANRNKTLVFTEISGFYNNLIVYSTFYVTL